MRFHAVRPTSTGHASRTGRPRRGWRTALGVGAAGVAVALVASCSGGGDTRGAASQACPVDALDDAEGVVDVVMWETFVGEPERTMSALVEEYNASQDRVRVTMENQGVAWEEIQRKFNSAINSGDLPQLAVLEHTQTQFLADSGVILPAEACFEAAGVDPGEFAEVARSFYSVDGVLQPGSPIPATGVMYYNRDHFEDAGLDPDDPPGTLAELRSAAEAIQSAGITRQPLVLLLQPLFVEHWLTGAGAEVVNNNNGRGDLADAATLDSDAAQELYAWLADMRDAGLVNPVAGNEGQVDHYFAMALQQASITLETSTAISTINAVLEGTLDASDLGLGGGELPAIDVNVDVAAFPGLSEPGRTQLGGGAFYLPNTSSPAGIAGAWDFLSWFNQAGVQARWMEGSTYNPWNTAATGEDTARQWFDTTRPGRWMQVPLDEVDRMDPAFPGPLIGPYAETRNAIRRSLEELLNNGADPADVLARANTTITEALRRYGDENF